ncbi:hypothetical protein ACN4EK_23875 [Pantanalinema rosaneae CENA516]|uniref:hypothetical protein n=1 Tax=Pantanalinema rosaneae TaxID=1620701 RepID=UPI003D6ED486
MQRSIQLLSGTGDTVAGLLCSMSDRHLEDFETIWKGVLRATEQPDSYWSWDYKLRQGNQESRYEAYAIEVDSLTQGLMFLETQWHRSQLPQRYPLVYVEALAVAPWNRRRLEDPPYLRGVGRTLLLFARQRSLELGYGGRVGLHSLPKSEEFYRRNQMPEYDPDPDKEGLVYFEYGVLRR